MGRVRNMEALFDQSAFNRPLDKWRVASVTNMYGMFYGATSFDQDLGWCVDTGVLLEDAFNGTRCEATACGVGSCAPSPAPSPSTTPAPTEDRTDAARRGGRVAVALVVGGVLALLA